MTGGNSRLVLALSLLALGCCAPRYSRVEESSLDPSIVMEKMKSYRDHIKSCRRIFSLEAKRGIARARGEGLFLFAEPGLYRLDVWDAMGNLLVHYVEDGTRRELVVTGGEELLPLFKSSEDSVQSGGFTIEEMKCLGLGAFSPPLDARVSARGRSGVVVKYPGEAEGVERRLHLFAGSGMPSRYEVTIQGEELRRADLSRVRTVSGIPRATRIEMVDHESSFRVELEIAQETLNEAIPESLFSPSGRAEVKP